MVRTWQHTIKVFTPAMRGVESGRLKEERIRGIGEGEKGAELPVETCEAGRDRVIILIYRGLYYWVSSKFSF